MSSLPIINKSYELYKQFTGVNDHMTKRWRLTLGKSIEESILVLLEQLVMAKNAPKTMKTAYLFKSSGILEVLTLGGANEKVKFKVQEPRPLASNGTRHHECEG